MGQKIHPTGFRLAVTRNWNSRWYANNRDFSDMLAEDIKVRDYLKSKLKNAAVSRVLIERPAKNARITIYSARPGVVMNPVDHPHGGGEGKTGEGRHPVDPWGNLTKGYRTRNNRRTQSMICLLYTSPSPRDS